jgi:hypothetical protein
MALRNLPPELLDLVCNFISCPILIECCSAKYLLGNCIDNYYIGKYPEKTIIDLYKNYSNDIMFVLNEKRILKYLDHMTLYKLLENCDVQGLICHLRLFDPPYSRIHSNFRKFMDNLHVFNSDFKISEKWYVEDSSIEIVKILGEKGIHIYAKEMYNLAIQLNNIKMLSIIISIDPCPNPEYILSMAAIFNRIEIIKSLEWWYRIKDDKSHWHAICYASGGGKIEIVKHLTTVHLDFQHWIYTAISEAERNNHPEIVNYLENYLKEKKEQNERKEIEDHPYLNVLKKAHNFIFKDISNFFK